MKKLCKLALTGLMLGCTVFVLLGMIFAAVLGDGGVLTGSRFICHALSAMAVGMGFSIPAMIYESEKITLPLKALIHMGSGFAIYFAVGLPIGWIPTEYGPGATASAIGCAVLTSSLIWLGFYLYNRREARQINSRLSSK